MPANGRSFIGTRRPGAGALSCRWLRSLDIRRWRTTGVRRQGQDHGRTDTGIVHEMASLNTHYPAGAGRTQEQERE
ncbi:GD18887 [Drosophila simulans]|uniref:GD18887 n=1 Tax=Drosophila simulans TaxID=7240 RepID=B4R1V6_DROSI|nr:GD18887 [Drosophila simulans]